MKLIVITELSETATQNVKHAVPTQLTLIISFARSAKETSNYKMVTAIQDAKKVTTYIIKYVTQNVLTIQLSMKKSVNARDVLSFI